MFYYNNIYYHQLEVVVIHVVVISTYTIWTILNQGLLCIAFKLPYIM
jgi:hypothetical protein